MDAARVEGTFGTYRPRRATTRRERRTALWLGAVALCLLAGWGVVRARSDGADAVLDLAAFAAVIVGANALGGFATWRWGPQTRLDAEGVRVMTGLTGGRHLVPWDAVVGVETADRFTGHPVLVLRDGRRLVLPGVPAAAADELREACPSTRAARPTAERRPAPPVVDAEDSWDGPFHRG